MTVWPAGPEVTHDQAGDATRGLIDPSLNGWCAQSLDRVGDAMAALVCGAGPFEDLLAHVRTAPGKRLRSLVTLAASCLDSRRITPTPEAVEVAAAIEMIHEAALLHDDILDGSIVRRGQPSGAARFGIRTTIYAGAFLAAKGLAVLAASSARHRLPIHLGFLKSLAAAEIVESVPPVRDSEIRRRSLLTIVDGKTGILFLLATRMGLGIGGTNGSGGYAPDRLDPFAVALGRAFQVRDDVMDFLPAPPPEGESAGRDLGPRGESCDLTRGILNWPVHFWLLGQRDPGQGLARLRRCGTNRDVARRLRMEIVDSGAVERSLELMDTELNQALLHLGDAPPSVGRRVLGAIVRSLRL